MDIKKILSIVDGADKQSLTEGKGMQKQMIMDHYQKPQNNAVTKHRSNINEYFKVVDNEMLNALKESQEQKRIEVKKVVNRVLERLDESKTKKDAPKPRNFVAKNAVQSGAGAHKDKKKAAKQGDVKHKNKEIEMAEGEKKGLYYYVNKRKKAGTSRDASSPKAPTAQAWKDATKTAKKESVAEAGSPAQQAAIAISKKKEKQKQVKESTYGGVEVGTPVKVYSNILKKSVFGKVVNIKEGRAYVQYNNTKIVMGHPIETVKLNEAAATTAATTVAKAAPGVAGKMASRLVPGLGAAVGAYDAYDRAKKGDYIGAGLSGLGAVTSFIPGIGTAATMGLTGAQLARDYKMKTGAFAPDETEAGQAATPAPGAMTPNPAKSAGKYPTTQDEIKAFQKANGLAVDGIIGKNTKAALDRAGLKPATPGQAATPAPASNNMAAAARTVAPAASAIAQQALK